MKKIIVTFGFTVLFCFFISYLAAQDYNWNWVKSCGDINIDEGRGIAIDNLNNIYITGSFRGVLTLGEHTLVGSMDPNLFVAKLNATGDCIWAIKSEGSAFGNALAVDNSANVFVTGSFFGANTFGSTVLNSLGNSDIFVSKIGSNGNWIWTQRAGGTMYDNANAIALDSNSAVYITGAFEQLSSFGNTNLVSNGAKDIYVAKLNPGGNWLWARQAGAANSDEGFAIALDAASNVYAAGCFADSVAFGAIPLISALDTDCAFVVKLSNNGNWLWAKQVVGSTSKIVGIAIDNITNIYVTGSYANTVSFGASVLNSGEANPAAFIAKMNANGHWIWARSPSGVSSSVGRGIALDSDANPLITGSFLGTQSYGGMEVSSFGASDIFVSKFDPLGNWQWTKHAGSALEEGIGFVESGNAIKLDSANNIHVCGSFIDSAGFGDFTAISNGNKDIFVSKLSAAQIPEPQFITITSDPSGASVFIDGVLAGITPYEDLINPGGSFEVSVTLNTYTFEPPSQTVIWQPYPQIVHFIGSMQATIIDPNNLPPVWEAGLYIINTPIYIDPSQTITMNPGVMVNIVTPDTISVAGILNANGAVFSTAIDSLRWGGFRFLENVARQNSFLENCEIFNALTPISLENNDSSITNLLISPSDTTAVVENPAIRITGDASPNIQDLQIVNYQTGVLIEATGNPRRSTPTLSNIRIMNSSSSSRTDSLTTGIKLIGETSANIDNAVMDNCGVGIKAESDENSTLGTPTLSNIRIMNSSSSSRSTTKGVWLDKAGDISLNSIEISDCTEGMRIQSIDSQFSSTPTLSNIRIMNSSNPSRTGGTAIFIEGKVSVQIDDMEISDYDTGIWYKGDYSMPLRSTPTLSNIRIRNSSSSSRPETIGIKIQDLVEVIAENDSIDGFGTGIEISVTEADMLSTPTLSNIRIKNSSSSARTLSKGIVLGTNVAGSISNSKFEATNTGILCLNGNITLIENNRFQNCEVGISSSSMQATLPISKNEFLLEASFQNQNPEWSFRAIDCYQAGPHRILNNTINGYPAALKAEAASVQFINNIFWNTTATMTPFILMTSNLNQSYNNILYADGTMPGIGNINADPMFNSTIANDFSLNYNSPCIDSGDPMYFDEDGSRSDIGAFTYLHKAEFSSSAHTVPVGTEVYFQNLSIGHDQPNTQVIWDLNNDNIIEATSTHFSYVFHTAGSYDLRLKMQTGNLIDEIVVLNAVVVGSVNYPAPEGVFIMQGATGLRLVWEPITHNAAGELLPSPVENYVVYHSADPFSPFEILGFTAGGETQMPLLPDRCHFYYVIGFDGDRSSLRGGNTKAER